MPTFPPDATPPAAPLRATAAGKGFSLEEEEREPQRDLFLVPPLSLSPLSLRPLITCSAVGVLRPEVGGLWDGVMEAEAMPLMSMVGEVREERGVSMVEGIEEMGGDLDLTLADEMSSTAAEKILTPKKLYVNI